MPWTTADAADRNTALLPAMHAGLSGIDNAEMAGADEDDKATKKQLREADTPMVPAKPANPTQLKPKSAEKPATISKPAQAPKKAEPAPAKMAKPEPKPEPKPAKMPAEPASAFGHYVRGDASYGWTRDSDAVGSTGALSGVDIDRTASFSGGIGFRLDKMFRVDGTLGYRPESDVGARDGIGRATNTEVDAVTAMVSAYVDLTPVHDLIGSDMVTPYLGAGIGFARLGTEARSIAGAASEGGTTTDNMAYQLMTGLTFKVSQQLFVDFGYRFANLGQFEQSGTFTNGTSALKTEFDDLMVHEASLGLRLQF